MLEYMFMPFQRYAEFSGRSRRMEYWAFTLLNFIIMLILGGLATAVGMSVFSTAFQGGAAPSFGVGFSIVMILVAIYLLIVLIPSIAVTVRRLHDRDMSGWWYLGFILLGAIPFVGWIASIAFLVILFLPGTPGPNRFGEDPKDPTGSEVFA